MRWREPLGADALAPLLALLRTVRSVIDGGAAADGAAAEGAAAEGAAAAGVAAAGSWLSSWRPLVSQQHGDLLPSNVLVDAQVCDLAALSHPLPMCMHLGRSLPTCSGRAGLPLADGLLSACI